MAAWAGVHGGGNEVGLDGIGVDAVVEHGQGAVEVPGQRKAADLVVFLLLVFLDLVDLEFGADPHADFYGVVLVGVGAAVSARAGLQADGPGFLRPLLYAELVAVEARLAFNYGEFAVIKSGVVDRLPNAEEFDGVAVSEPVGNEKVPVLGFEHVGQGNEIPFLTAENGHVRSPDVDGGFLGLG